MCVCLLVFVLLSHSLNNTPQVCEWANRWLRRSDRYLHTCHCKGIHENNNLCVCVCVCVCVLCCVVFVCLFLLSLFLSFFVCLFAYFDTFDRALDMRPHNINRSLHSTCSFDSPKREISPIQTPPLNNSNNNDLAHRRNSSNSCWLEAILTKNER
jgi:hypothetical protein